MKTWIFLIGSILALGAAKGYSQDSPSAERYLNTYIASHLGVTLECVQYGYHHPKCAPWVWEGVQSVLRDRVGYYQGSKYSLDNGEYTFTIFVNKNGETSQRSVWGCEVPEGKSNLRCEGADLKSDQAIIQGLKLGS